MKTKHSELHEGSTIRGRGRPKKYPLTNNKSDFEIKKFENFFNLNNRGPEEGKIIDLNSLIEDVFKFYLSRTKFR